MELSEKFLTLWKDADPGIAEVDDAKKRLAGLEGYQYLNLPMGIIALELGVVYIIIPTHIYYKNLEGLTYLTSLTCLDVLDMIWDICRGGINEK